MKQSARGCVARTQPESIKGIPTPPPKRQQKNATKKKQLNQARCFKVSLLYRSECGEISAFDKDRRLDAEDQFGFHIVLPRISIPIAHIYSHCTWIRSGTSSLKLINNAKKVESLVPDSSLICFNILVVILVTLGIRSFFTRTLGGEIFLIAHQLERLNLKTSQARQ